MNVADPAWTWGVALIAFAFGVVIGIVISYLLLTQNKRAGQLQSRLDETRAEFDNYRNEVNYHFQTTSELFQDMTRQYKAVYEHLARGAQNLCGDEVDAPRLDIPEQKVLDKAAEEVQARRKAEAAEDMAGGGDEQDEYEYAQADAPREARDQERQTA